MPSAESDRSLTRLVAVARLSCVTGILALTLTFSRLHGLQTALLLCATAAAATFLQVRPVLSPAWVAAVEAAAAGGVIGWTLPAGAIGLPYLLIPPLAAGCAKGIRPMAWSSVAQALTVLVPAVVFGQLSDASTSLRQLSPWLLTAAGIGLLGARLRAVGPVRRGDDVPYESARRLIGELRTVTGRLSAGLDSVGMAEQLLSQVHVSAPASWSLLFVRNDTAGVVPLARHTAGSGEWELSTAHSLVAECLARETPVQRTLSTGAALPTHLLALPLSVDDRVIGVVAAALPGPPEPPLVADLARTLSEYALRLDTALAFEEVRNVATSEERRRVAGEIHDGIAQETAALGYLVDELSARAESADQRDKLAHLRSELSRLVGELRLSIFELRSTVTPKAGLAAALAEHVRRVSARSSMRVHLSLDETMSPLRPDVEIELLRIAQEAIANARRHSGAENVWVTCRARPPVVRLEVEDDGTWLGEPGEDSYGLRIMRERAERIDATFAITPRAGGGTRVSVELLTAAEGLQPAEEVSDRAYERVAGR